MTLPTDYNARKAFPLLTFLTAYMPDAIEALVHLSIQGNVQHEIATPKLQPFYLPGDRIAWDRSKSTEETETAMRHLWDHMRGKRSESPDNLYDSDGILHIVKTAWRALAEAQKTIEAERKREASRGVNAACDAACELRGAAHEERVRSPFQAKTGHLPI
jgi:hypothetical protein